MSVALYPGTFDPITLGHLDLIHRALRVFDRLVVAVGHNPQKAPLFTVEERVEMIRKVTEDLSNLEVTHYDELLIEFARKQGIFTVIRSLRSTTEFEVELSTAVANRRMSPDFEAVFLMPSVEYNFLSSTVVREIAQFGGDVSTFVPPLVAERLRERFETNPDS